LEDDLNTPDVITSLRRLYREATDEIAFAGTRLVSCGHLLGLFEKDLADWEGVPIPIDKQRVQSLIEGRLKARAAKNWAESDRLRDELVEMGIALKDNKDGTTSWGMKR